MWVDEEFGDFVGNHPYDGSRREKDFVEGFTKLVGLVIPPRAFQKEALDIHTVVGLLREQGLHTISYINRCSRRLVNSMQPKHVIMLFSPVFPTAIEIEHSSSFFSL